MKRIILFVMAALLLAGCAVPKESAEPAPAPTPVSEVVTATSVPVSTDAPVQDASCWTTLDPAAAMAADIDGDGVDETITVAVDEDAYVTDVTVTHGGATLTDHLDTALMFLKAYYGDAKLDDGSRELYLTGDTASDDYSTFIYRIRDGKLQKAEIFGEVMNADGAGLTIERAVDVLGTYGGTCRYALNDGFTFSRVSPFMITRYEGDWQERVLTLQKDGLPLTGAMGENTLAKGTELMLVETDQESYAELEDRQGIRYRISITKPEEDWRWFIGGVAEDEWFGELLYAG